MRLGVISGSGGYEWPGLRGVGRQVETPHGAVLVMDGRIENTDVVHLSRHGAGHARLSNHVQHRANLAALIAARVDAVISFTLCGAVAPELKPGSLIVFDDLYFPGNRLPDGSLCTWHDSPGMPQRGHWIFERPFSDVLRRALIDAGTQRRLPVRDSGCYGHVDGPRFNSRAEIAALARAGVAAVSQTAGPETVLAGEAELPFALVGFVTDYANGVVEHTEPVEALVERMRASSGVFASLLAQTCASLPRADRAGFVYRFEP